MGTPEPWEQHSGALDLRRGWESSSEHLDVQGKPGIRGAWAWSSTETGPQAPFPTQGLRPQGTQEPGRG